MPNRKKVPDYGNTGTEARSLKVNDTVSYGGAAHQVVKTGKNWRGHIKLKLKDASTGVVFEITVAPSRRFTSTQSHRKKK